LRVHLINPSDTAFGTAVITPRWLFVLAAATPEEFGDPVLCDETLEALDVETVAAGDIVGIGIHTGNALRGYAIGRLVKQRGAFVVFGGIHTTLYPGGSFRARRGGLRIRGDGDIAWGQALRDHLRGAAQRVYEGGRIDASQFKVARWDLLDASKYMWGSVQTVRGCAKHCSFCSVWRTDGQRPRQRPSDPVIEEIVELRRRGFRFIALADDNFYPVSLTDIRLAERQNNQAKVATLKAIRAERFELMERLAELPKGMVFFTQITMEAAEDPEFLKAMRKARIMGALVGIEAVTAEGLKAVFKDFNLCGENLVERLRQFQEHGIHILGSFIFGLPTDRPDTFQATQEMAQRSGIAFAQFVMLTPFCGTVDFERWEKSMGDQPPDNRWNSNHTLLADSAGQTTQDVYAASDNEFGRDASQNPRRLGRFYSLPAIWRRSACTPTLRARLAFVFISKLYRQMYASTGIATDSARRERATQWARRIAKVTRRLFQAAPMPDLQLPRTRPSASTNPLRVVN
jgi:hypothetical protein